MKFLWLLSVIFLFGCATEQGYKNYLMQFKGISKAQLLEAQGVPDNVYEYNGTEYLVYLYTASYYVPQTSFVNGYNSYGYTNATVNSYGGYSGTVSCKTTYVLQNGIVTSIRFVGNGCKA